ncbi:ribosome maturation factor RimM [Porphyrobacter sp. GA68]|uniref:ribosome maturation factor RimM n=1 Tax=Porphyrobacter sp. GA68 TaxID=2883480 RepID=UPI001D17F7B1|nr:ribosome maturation factor RimM [Porphyrobacter sp. GA68]
MSGTPADSTLSGGEPADKAITLAAIAGAHGVAGEVRLKLLGDGVDGLRAHKLFNNGALRLSSIRSDGKGGAIARVDGVHDRTAAEALRGTALTVPRSSLPPLAEGEFYHADLLDLPVVNECGDPVGRVVAVENFGATDIVEVERDGGGRFMVPLTPDAVPDWNAERLVVNAAFNV